MSKRINWHDLHMSQAELIAERSTCAKLKVGAVLIKDNRTISQGYNGVGPKCRHCDDFWYDIYVYNNNLDEFKYADFKEFLASSYFRERHKNWSLQHELHAEQNCILWAARNGIPTCNTILYTTFSPCINCAKVIFMAGIKEVYYKNLYMSDISGKEYLEKNNIICTTYI